MKRLFFIAALILGFSKATLHFYDSSKSASGDSLASWINSNVNSDGDTVSFDPYWNNTAFYFTTTFISISHQMVQISGCSAGQIVFVGPDPAGNSVGIHFVTGSNHSGVECLSISGFGTGLLFDADYNCVRSSKIGTNPTGTGSVPNRVGIMVNGKYANIGGEGVKDPNTISGNNMVGVFLSNGGEGTVISHSFIGTDSTGSYSLNSGQVGIYLEGNLTQSISIINNTISGNGGDGVSLNNKVSHVRITTNLIGTDKTGTVGIPNANGVRLNAVTMVIVGGLYLGQNFGNLISANNAFGVIVENGANNNYVGNNIIGSDVSGMIPLGNEYDGITVRTGSYTNDIGGDTTTSTGNFIYANERHGVSIFGCSYNRVVVSFNGGNGIYATYSENLNIHNNTFGSSSGGNSLDGVSFNHVYSSQVTTNVVLSNTLDGIYDTNGYSNSFENNWIGVSDAAGSFGNQLNGIAILQGSNDTISGNLISENGQNGISLQTSTHIQITKNTIGLDFDQNNAPNGGDGINLGSSPSNYIYSNYIDANTGNGITLSSSSSNTVHLNEIDSNGGNGISVISSQSNSITNNQVLGNTLNGISITSPTIIMANLASRMVPSPSTSNTISSNLVISNGEDGITLDASPSNTIQNNTISSNDGNGLSLLDGSNLETVWSNIIGLDATGSRPDSNGENGIYVELSDNETIHGNIISANNQDGILFVGSDFSLITLNIIGLDKGANGSFGNSGFGIEFTDGSDSNRVTFNDIAFNNLSGINEVNSQDNWFWQNYIHQNVITGIQIEGPASSNGNILNHPTILSVVLNDTGIFGGTFYMELIGTPNAVYTIDYYYNVVPDYPNAKRVLPGKSKGKSEAENGPNHNAQAQYYIGENKINVSSQGEALFTYSFTKNVSRAVSFVATATTVTFATSDISDPYYVNPNAMIPNEFLENGGKGKSGKGKNKVQQDDKMDANWSTLQSLRSHKGLVSVGALGMLFAGALFAKSMFLIRRRGYVTI